MPVELLPLYLDSDVWIDFLWSQNIVSNPQFIKENKKREFSAKTVSLLSEEKHRVVVSLFHNTEISSYFRDWILFKHALNKGFDFRNFYRYKRNLRLSREDREEINSHFAYITELPFVDSVELEGLNKRSLGAFTLLTTDYGLEYMDALHLIVAMSEGCRYVITGDLDFRDKGNKFLREGGLIQDIRILSTKDFQSLLK